MRTRVLRWGGCFHPERRLGCIGCPLATDNGRGDFLKYPKMLKAVCKAADEYLRTHPTSRASQVFSNGYELMMKRLFFKTMADWDSVMGDSLFPELRPDARQYLSEYFKIEL